MNHFTHYFPSEKIKRSIIKAYYIFSTVFFLLFQNITVAQTVDVGPPMSWLELLPEDITYQSMPEFDLAAVRAEDAINDALKDGPWRFGYEHNVKINVLRTAEVHEIPGHGKIYRLGIESEGAMSINLVFHRYVVPQGATLHLYDEAHEHLIGAYTALNNHPSGQLGTELVPGDRITVEYFEPADVTVGTELTIGMVVHGYRSPGIIAEEMLRALNDSGDCNHDVLCPTGNGWENQIRSVGLIFTGGGTCSGALINNTEDNGDPLFLTARHCGLSVGNWAVRFNWESTVARCASAQNSVDPGPPYDQTANGATLLASNSGSDFTLSRLDNLSLPLMQQWNLYLAGWDRSDNAPSSSTGIHHPSGDVKKICRDNNSATKNTINFNGDPNAQMWRIADWDIGVTEPGSSGSPLFDQNQRIIGQLCCGAAACNGTTDNDLHDHYGRLGVSWDGASASVRLKDWLDPNGGSAPNFIDGLDPNDLPPFNDLCANAPTLSCGDAASGTTMSATSDDAPAICSGGGTPNQGVWFRFTGTGDIVTVSTAGSAFDTQLSLYEGSCGNLTCVDGDDDSGPGTTSGITFCSVNGTTYYAYLDGFGGITGNYEFSLSCTPDVTPPSITCPANVTVSNDAGDCGAIVNYSAANVSDFCGATVSYSQNSGTFFPVGVTVVTATATDNNNNSNSCDFTVTVNDTEAPTAVCLNSTVFLQPDGMYTLKNSDVLDGGASFDNCSFSVTNISPPVVDCDDANMIIPISVTITDPAGNSDDCIANTTVLIGTALPAPWVGSDVGNPGLGNNYEYDPCIPPLGEFTIEAGATNNNIPNDNLAFINQPICGDFQIDAKLESVSNGYGGLLIRENNSPGSKMVGMYSNLSTIVRWESRMMANGPKQINAFNRPFPIWLRLIRQGNWVFGYISTNGINYNPVHGSYFPAGACAQIGMSAFNYIPGSTATAIFSNVVVGPPSLMPVTPPTLPESVYTSDGEAGIQAELFPNPVTKQLTLRFHGAQQQPLELHLYNSRGQVMLTKRLEAISGPINWEVQDLPTGAYLIDARFADGTRKGLRFIKD